MNYHMNYAETIKNCYNAWLFPLISSQEGNRNADDIPSMNRRNSTSRTHSCSGPYTTPQKFGKQIRQRTY